MTDEFSKALDNYASRIADTLNGFGAENTRLRDEARARVVALRDENDRENDVLLKATEIMRAQRDAAEQERDALALHHGRKMVEAQQERDRLRADRKQLLQTILMQRRQLDEAYGHPDAALARPTATAQEEKER